jgi:single-stranded-DNA-specific exonuclease
LAVELLTTQNTARAKDLAQYLEDQNSQRQGMERKITQEAKEQLEGTDWSITPGIVIASEVWHQGVVGIVASRLVEHFARPALVMTIKTDEAIAVGSGRSVPGFALHEALHACSEHLIGHGGHAAAAGFKLKPEKIADFRAAFIAYASVHFQGVEPPAPQLLLDTEVPLSAITHGLLRDIDKLEPYGAGNPKPKFLACGLKVEAARKIGTGDVQRHMDFKVRQGETVIRAVAWNMADRLEELTSANGDCCLVFTPKVNDFRGARRLELQVIDLRPGATAELC